MDTDMKIAAKPTTPLEDFVIEDPYHAWQKREGVRVLYEYVFGDLANVELSPWPRKGGAGARADQDHAGGGRDDCSGTCHRNPRINTSSTFLSWRRPASTSISSPASQRRASI